MMRRFTKPVFLLLMLCITAICVQAQSVVISGSVTDKLSKEPVPGAGITVKGKTVGTTTNQSGKYAFSTTQKAPFILIISFLGYTTVEKLITGNTTDLNIELEQEGILGQEVVIFSFQNSGKDIRISSVYRKNGK